MGQEAILFLAVCKQPRDDQLVFSAGDPGDQEGSQARNLPHLPSPSSVQPCASALEPGGKIIRQRLEETRPRDGGGAGSN